MIERGGFSSGERMRLALGGALLAACVLATIGLRFVPAYAPFAITGRTHAAMRTGELRTLRGLGMHDAVQDLVEVEGRIELAELLAIEREARNVGAAEYQRLARVVTDAGAQRFSALGRQEQARIREASLVTFLITEGARAANVGLPPGTEPTTFAPSVPDVEVATRLGRASLGAADAARLGDRTAADPALAADLSLLSLAVDAAESGERIYLATRRRLMEAGEGVFRALDFDAQQRVRNASYSEFVYTQGFADVPADVKARLGRVDVLTDTTAANALRLDLGRAALAPSKRERIARFDGAALGEEGSARMRAFVTSRGERRVTALLRGFFREARCRTMGRRRAGAGAGDLMRRGLADERLRCEHGAREIVVGVRARWDVEHHEWMLDSIENFHALVAERPTRSDDTEVEQNP